MKKRIVLILSSFPKLSESFIVNKFIGLLYHNLDVHVICQNSESKDWELFPKLGQVEDIKKRIHKIWPVHPSVIVVLLYPVALLKCAFTNPKGLYRYFSSGWKIQRWTILKSFYLNMQLICLKPDLIHFEFGATAVEKSYLNQLLGCREIVSFRGYDLNFSGLDEPDYYQNVWKNADGFHFLGEDLRQRALDRGCPEGKRFALIPPAIDISYFCPEHKKKRIEVGSKESPLRILSVGRLEWKKGYEYGFQAIRNLIENGIYCEYHIIGSGNYLAALAFARHQLNLEDIIIFLGAQPKEKVREELNWADVFLHSAVSEGFCNAVLEAQSMRVPVVCTDAGGLPENIVDGVTGFVVPRRDPKALAARLEVLAEDPLLRENMGQAGRKRVKRNFQLSDQIELFYEFYLSILNENESN